MLALRARQPVAALRRSLLAAASLPASSSPFSPCRHSAAATVGASVRTASSLAAALNPKAAAAVSALATTPVQLPLRVRARAGAARTAVLSLPSRPFSVSGSLAATGPRPRLASTQGALLSCSSSSASSTAAASACNPLASTALPVRAFSNTAAAAKVANSPSKPQPPQQAQLPAQSQAQLESFLPAPFARAEELLLTPLPAGLAALPLLTEARAFFRALGSVAAAPRLVAALPPALQHYAHLARLEKPIGTWLLLLPCYWGAALVSPQGAPALSLCAALAVGAVAMRGAGCTINDLWDRDFDRRVARTQTRPLASGAVSAPQALGFTARQWLVGLAVLPAIGDLRVAAVAMAAVPLVVAYPLMKRYTNWPQAVLGLTFNWGLWVGAAAAVGVENLAPHAPALALLHLGGVAWTIFYDTVYALQDTQDDKEIGVKSTALHFGPQIKAYLRAFAWAAAGCFAAAGLVSVNSASIEWLCLTALLPLRFMLQQVRALDPTNREACGAAFRAHRNIGLLILLGVMLGTFAVGNDEKMKQWVMNEKGGADVLKQLGDRMRAEAAARGLAKPAPATAAAPAATAAAPAVPMTVAAALAPVVVAPSAAAAPAEVGAASAPVYTAVTVAAAPVKVALADSMFAPAPVVAAPAAPGSAAGGDSSSVA